MNTIRNKISAIRLADSAHNQEIAFDIDGKSFMYPYEQYNALISIGMQYFQQRNQA
jgi:hypothetical protein